MDFPEVKAFNAELSGLYDNKPPISKAKMSAITRGAIKAIKFYKHVVHSVEKFIQKCKPEYKVPGLYVIDSIVRQSRHQFGQDKDVFAPRFAKNMQQTFANLFRCPPENKGNIIRVLNLWQKNNVFGPEVIQPLMDMADPNHPLHQEIQQQQNNTANGSSMNLNTSHSSDKKLSPVPAPLHTPPDNSPMGDSFHDQPSSNSGVKFNRKLLNDFEYESEDDSAAHEPPPTHSHSTHSTHTTHATHAVQQPTAETLPLGSILTNPEIMRQLQSLQAQMQLMTGMQIPNLMPMMNDMQMQQNQNQNLPFLSKDQQKQKDSKDDMVESDIEFVETGPQVIEIPDANDSRSPSPRRRGRSRSRSRRRRSRSRSRSPRRRRDGARDRDRDRDRDRTKDREKSHKEREADKEKQREREKKGLPPIKKENLSVCSTTLWVGHVSKLATQEELSDLFGALGGVAGIDVVAPRGCAFVVMERRRDAHKAKATLNRHKLHSKEIKVGWAPGRGVKGREWKDYWEAELGVSYLPWAALHARWVLGALSLDALEDGGHVDEDTLPPWLPPRIIPKSMLDGMGMMGNLALPGAALPAMPAAMPPGMPGGMPPGMPPGLPPGMRPPSLPTGVPGLTNEALASAGALLRFPGLPQPMPALPQPGMGQLGGFLGGLVPALGVGGLVGGVALHPARMPAPPQPQQARPAEVTRTDDAMELDTEDHTDQTQQEPAPPLLSDQLQALLSKPPPNFNSAEPPPNFNVSEPPPFSQPPPDKEEDKKDRDRERRDRDRDGRRDRDRDRRDRGGRDRDRAGKDRDRDRGDRDRDRDRGRERRDRDRDRDNRDRGNAPRDNNRDRSRSKSPREAAGAGANAGPGAGTGAEKSLQERLWEMANGKRDDFPAPTDGGEENRAERGPPPDRMPRLPIDAESEKPPADGDGGWTALPPRHGAPHLLPPFRAELRMRGPPRQPMRGPWMDGPGQGPGAGPGPFGPRFNGLGPFNRPPFDGGPIFDGPPRFERPPFARMPFDGPRPPFDGPRPPFDGPRPPFDGPRPPFDGPRPPFDGPRPPFDGPRPPFDGPRPFDGPFDGDRPFEGPPRFDGPPEFFDRNNRRFEDREFGDRGWNGDRDRERGDRDWGEQRRGEWDDRRRDRFRDHEDRFRDRPDRRRNFEERPERSDRPDRGDRPDRDRSERGDKDRGDKERGDRDRERRGKEERSRPDRQKDRKSRWGAAEQAPAEDAEAPANADVSQATDPNTVETDKVENPDSGDAHRNVENENNESNSVPNEPMETATDARPVEAEPMDTAVESENKVSRDEPVVEQEPSYNEETREDPLPAHRESKDSFEPRETEPEQPTIAPAPDLYDANESVDTSFALPAEEQHPTEIPESAPVPEQTESKSDDIFEQPKEAETSSEIKESLEAP